MPVFKRPGSQTYSYDFRIKGIRYSGSTTATTKREAEKLEERERQKAQVAIVRESEPLTVGMAIGRYYHEVGQHHVNFDTTLHVLAWLEKELGKNRLIESIKDADIARMVSKRRLDKVSPATINRSVIQPMRAVLARSADIWGQTVHPVKWGKLLLKEPEERVRELTHDEEVRLFSAIREDYAPIIRFSLLTGCRMQECLDLTWRMINWSSKQMRVTGKGKKTRTIPMTDALTALLKDLPRAHEFVFTYVSQRADNAPRGARVPIAREGLKITFKRTMIKAQIEDFSFHDLRHTAATRLLRSSGNLRLVKELLGHSDMNTTLKYAHVTKEDLLAAMNATENATSDVLTEVKVLKDNGNKV